MISFNKNTVKVDLASYRHYWRGEKKIGKTSLFASLMEALYGDVGAGLEIAVGNERGYKAIDGLVYVETPDWPSLMELINELVENKNEHGFKFVCIDTVDEMIEIAKKEVIRVDRRKTKERHDFNGCLGGYGAPRDYVYKIINSVITRLEDSGYGLIFVGHTKFKDVKEKNGDVYQKLTSNLNKDFNDIFANKADINMMIGVERDIEGKQIQGVKRWMYFRDDGMVDAGCRFKDIEGRVELSAENYISVVKDAIKSSMNNKNMTDEDMAKKANEEQSERDEYYENHKEEILNADPDFSADEMAVVEVENIRNEIAECLGAMSTADKRAMKTALQNAGLPTAYKKVEDVDSLKKILEIVRQ